MLEGQDIRPEGRLAQWVRMIDAFERDDVERAVDMLIDRLDAAAGDPDLEPNGDELDGNGCEDDFGRHKPDGLAGCPIADPGATHEDSMGDPAWIEWQTRGSRKVDRYGAERLARDATGNPLHEAVEDDDPAGGNIADEPHDAEEDFGAEERGEAGAWPEAVEQREGGGCYPDDGQEDDGAAVRRLHRDRIRSERCAVSSRWGYPEYRLREYPGASARIGVAADLID